MSASTVCVGKACLKGMIFTGCPRGVIQVAKVLSAFTGGLRGVRQVTQVLSAFVSIINNHLASLSYIIMFLIFATISASFVMLRHASNLRVQYKPLKCCCDST